VKKPCVGCGKQIPEAALHCVFCGAKQASADSASEAASADDVPSSLGEALRRAADGPPAPATSEAAAHPSKAGVTLLGLRVDDVQAAIAAHAARADAPVTPIPLDPTPARGLPVLGSVDAPASAQQVPSPWSALVRLVMASGGVVLIALFSLPWHGVGSWQLLETLAGADFVRQFFYLSGGAVLFATAVLPVPNLFRAVVGVLVASLPLVLGAEGMVAGWRGVGAALVIVSLPATHLVRTLRSGRLDARARTLVMVAAGSVAVLYLVPVSQVVPLVYVARMLSSASVGPTVVGLFISIPLVLAALSLLGALGRDLASVAVLLAVLILLWPPAALLLFVDDGTQLYLALGLLWTSAIAALCLAQVLTLGAGRGAKRA
jgi:hypothetical protein